MHYIFLQRGFMETKELEHVTKMVGKLSLEIWYSKCITKVLDDLLDENYGDECYALAGIARRISEGLSRQVDKLEKMILK